MIPWVIFYKLSFKLNLYLGPSHVTVQTAIMETSNAILQGLHGIVNWPDNENECRTIAHSFSQIDGVQNVVGAVDGTLINVRCPSRNAATFRFFYNKN